MIHYALNCRQLWTDADAVRLSLMEDQCWKRADTGRLKKRWRDSIMSGNEETWDYNKKPYFLY